MKIKNVIFAAALAMSSFSLSAQVYTAYGNVGSTQFGINHVGVATNAPLAPLDVNGRAYFRNHIGIGALATSYTMTLQGVSNDALFHGISRSGKSMMTINTSNSNPFLTLYNSAGTVQTIKLNGGDYSYFNNNGGLLIGLSTLSNGPKLNNNGDPYRLYVTGGIISEEMKVELAAGNWADYVFAEDYELKTLEEVEATIEEKGHLHNIDSAEKLEEEGLELKSITINQQEKIEELFLHMIEMNKRMKALEEENAKLKAQVQELSK